MSAVASSWCALLLKNPRVLLAEDDPELAGTLRGILERGGAIVNHCKNGHDALVSLKSFNPDILITDLGLPHITGNEFLAEARRLGFEKPAIIISGSQEIQHFSDAFRNAANAFLVKPFRVQRFMFAVQEALSRESARILREQEFEVLLQFSRGVATRAEVRQQAIERISRSR
jgi:two-component system, OmpR family, response regulator